MIRQRKLYYGYSLCTPGVHLFARNKQYTENVVRKIPGKAGYDTQSGYVISWTLIKNQTMEGTYSEVSCPRIFSGVNF